MLILHQTLLPGTLSRSLMKSGRADALPAIVYVICWLVVPYVPSDTNRGITRALVYTVYVEIFVVFLRILFHSRNYNPTKISAYTVYTCTLQDRRFMICEFNACENLVFWIFTKISMYTVITVCWPKTRSYICRLVQLHTNQPV